MKVSRAVASVAPGTAGAVPIGATATAAIARQPAARVAYLDRLKVLLVAVIIAGHGALAYSDLEHAWPYQDVQEVALPHALNIALAVIFAETAPTTWGPLDLDLPDLASVRQ